MESSGEKASLFIMMEDPFSWYFSDFLQINETEIQYRIITNKHKHISNICSFISSSVAAKIYNCFYRKMLVRDITYTELQLLAYKELVIFGPPKLFFSHAGLRSTRLPEVSRKTTDLDQR